MAQTVQPLILTDDEVLENAHTTLEEHLELEADGYKCTTDDLFNLHSAVLEKGLSLRRLYP